MGGLLNNEKSRSFKQKRTKMKRGKGQKDPVFLSVFSTNAAGLKSKILNCKNEIKHFDAAIFTIQETHFVKKESFLSKDLKLSRPLEIKKMVEH